MAILNRILPALIIALSVNIYFFQTDKYLDIFNLKQPFVPMWRSVAWKGNSTNVFDYLLCPIPCVDCDLCPLLSQIHSALAGALDFQQSQSPRMWLAMHLTSVIALLWYFARFVILTSAQAATSETVLKTLRRPFDYAHGAFVVLIIVNCRRFGGLPVSTAIVVNVGFTSAMTMAYLYASRHNTRDLKTVLAWCVYTVAFGFPSYAEQLLYTVLLQPYWWFYAAATLLAVCFGTSILGDYWMQTFMLRLYSGYHVSWPVTLAVVAPLTWAVLRHVCFP